MAILVGLTVLQIFSLVRNLLCAATHDLCKQHQDEGHMILETKNLLNICKFAKHDPDVCARSALDSSRSELLPFNNLVGLG